MALFGMRVKPRQTLYAALDSFVQFRKKRQIVIADGAIQDLMHCIDSEPQD